MGGVVSLVIVNGVDVDHVLPEVSTALAVNIFAHSSNETKIQNVLFDHHIATIVAPL